MSSLCHLNFTQGHECIFGDYCVFAHTISKIKEEVVSNLRKQNTYEKKRLF